MPEILFAENFSAGYGEALFARLDMKLNKGNVTALIGPNGTGKSTLLKSFAGLIPPFSGRILLCGQPINDVPMRARAQKIASVFTWERIPFGMTVREFVSLGRIPFSGIFDLRTKKDEAAIDWALDYMNISSFATRQAGALSDGERSRVFLARALSSFPEVLLLDEPTAFLDVPHILSLFKLLKKFAVEKNAAVLLSTHHVNYAFRFSDELICLDGCGHIAEGTPAVLQSSEYLSWMRDSNEN
ncbi:MAG: ABC transporter ATP-binding protein [Fibrobacteraceae bacterium]|nr:ABC transporter ATP-binding protein [Fibrobacteraceae bacterium]